jgi:hypothetical protein
LRKKKKNMSKLNEDKFARYENVKAGQVLVDSDEWA